MSKREKSKQKERRNRGNRKYGQAKLRHSKKGILSCCIAGIVCAVMCAALIIAYISEGKAASYVGGMGMAALAIAITGCSFGFRGFREREKNYLTCKIGMVCNIFFIIGFVVIFCGGLF